MDTPITITALRGADLLPVLDDIARLRMRVFYEWPYLYQGDLDYERRYLATYAATPDAICVLAQAAGKVVGASTGLPLLDNESAFVQPFLESAIDPAQVFYFGESVVLTDYRGRGIGHVFFNKREQHACAVGNFHITAFCSVDRADNDPRRPADYRSNHAFWHKRGYQHQPTMKMQLNWEEIDRGDMNHTLSFWTRPLDIKLSTF